MQMKYKYDRAAYDVFRKRYDETMQEVANETDHWILTKLANKYVKWELIYSENEKKKDWKKFERNLTNIFDQIYHILSFIKKLSKIIIIIIIIIIIM